MLKKTFVLVGAALLLTSCASEHPTPVTVPQSAKTIAIVSSIPPQIRVAETGITVLQRGYEIVQVPDWHLDDISADAASATLALRYDVVRAKTDAWIDDSVYNLDKIIGRTGALSKFVRDHAHVEKPVDLYLLISLDDTPQPYDQSSTVLVGVGVSKMRHIFYTLPPAVHTFVRLTLIDGKTFEVIATTPVEHTPRGAGGILGMPESSPTENLDNFDWKDPWSKMSEAQHDVIRATLTTLLSASVTYTIKEMQLAP